MIGFKKVEPFCLGCKETGFKLSRSGHCADCAWAISQRFDLAGERLENEIKSDALKALDDAAEMIKIRAEINVNEARQREGDIVKAAGLEAKILTERNIRLRSDLIKAFRKIKTLEEVE